MVDNIGYSQPTLFLEWGQDLVVNQNGGLTLAFGWDMVRQRIIRRLLTVPQYRTPFGLLVPADYYFDTSYGLGLPRRIGDNMTTQLGQEIVTLTRAAILIDESVDTSQEPLIQLNKTGFQQYTLTIVVYLTNNTQGQMQFIWVPTTA